VQKFEKSFKDPEFCKLFADYVDEITDPKHREEQEAYISQLEGEKKVGTALCEHDAIATLV
jgi:dynein assembly factor 2, axonemal